MDKVHHPPPDLPDDVVLRVSGVSKKFCRNLRRSMWYGIQDLSRNLLGKTADCRPQTADFLGGEASSSEDAEVAPSGGSQGLRSAVCSLQSNSAGLRPAEFWALRDISFDLRRGECLGLIGRNGCGKTTLLRLIAGIFPPDQGEIAIRGRVGALIALGAGFHPHMTGRENVYLNGAILGLSKKEIDAQFEEIVDFAEIGEFIDAPVSTYSSGMRVRLGFAVATAIKPDLLLIDEVLAVGDANFRRKCYARLGSIQKQSAIILVSHHMAHIGQICNKGIMLLNGKIASFADAPTVISDYEKRNGGAFSNDDQFLHLESPVVSFAASFSCCKIQYGDSLLIEIHVASLLDIFECILRVVIYGANGSLVAEWHSKRVGRKIDLVEGQNTLRVPLKSVCLSPGIYDVSFALNDAGGVAPLVWSYKMHRLEVEGIHLGNCAYQLD